MPADASPCIAQSGAKETLNSTSSSGSLAAQCQTLCGAALSPPPPPPGNITAPSPPPPPPAALALAPSGSSTTPGTTDVPVDDSGGPINLGR